MTRVAWIALNFGLIVSTASRVSYAADAPIDFNRDIRPILSNNCYFCHGPDEKERKGGSEGKAGLRLDTEDGLSADLGGHAAIVKGNPDASELIKRVISGDPDTVMPPAKTGKKLTPREIDLLRRWVKDGATFSKHWSYAKPVRPVVPQPKDATWAKNDIDRFLLARLDKEGLKPQPEADRATLIRRLSLDITGLPPTLAEVDAFANDKSTNAYEKLVDRLLEKQSYGEHWARMWLDLARYADSAGYADDPARVIWAYRDYLIRALNKNVPLDQMTIDQIAGDLVENPTEDQLIATAFHRNTQTNSEGGTNDEEFRNVAVVDRVNTTMAVWMGTTIACAQCHNHKYDPLSQKEFFQLFAFFNQSEDADRRDESPLLSLLSAEDKARQTTLQTELVEFEKRLKTATPELLVAQSKWEQSLPTDLTWQTPQPSSAVSKSGTKLSINEGATVLASEAQKTDTYTIELPLSGKTLGALRLETLPHDSLPAKGPGLGGGNFVLSKLTASIVPPATSRLNGRFVRIEMPGKQKMLSLAEVQVFNGAENVALKGEAKQISTDYEGPAKLAIDGNTNGHYFEGKSVTHTALGDDVWWEVDLKSAQPIDRVVIWNRTDSGSGARLVNFKITVLDEARQSVWEQTSKEAPNPSQPHSLSGVRAVSFVAAFADYSQQQFEAAGLIDNKDLANKGWAVGGGIGAAHSLMLVTAKPVEVVPGSKLAVTLEHASKFESHLLGHFRLGVTDDPRAGEFVKTPANILALIRKPADQRSDADKAALTDYFLTTVAAEQQPTRDKIAATKKQLADIKPVTVPVMKELAATAQRKTQLQHRGNFMDLGEEVSAAVPSVWHQLPKDAPRNRLSLAKWLVDSENPLTGRVVVNRYFEKIFGNGIVLTAEEFGAQGDLPFHPELLDWLATEFTTNLKWDTKQLIKLLVTTAAYRQSSKVDDALFDRDPENRLLARGPRFRMTAETVRDQALFVAGLLSPKMYGPPVKPPQPSLGVSAAFGSGIDWSTSDGEDKYRRGLYTTWRRSNPYPSMATFDAPNREVCLLRRPRTNTPLQALVTLNDPVYIEAAQALARRMLKEGGATASEQARYGFRLCLAREPSQVELTRLVKLQAQAREQFAKSPTEAMNFATKPIGAAPAGVDVADLAAWTVVGNVLLNLDEMFMSR
jgi:hypothetical protein